MDQKFQSYLDFLISLKPDSGQLSNLIQQKTIAIEENAPIKPEQTTDREQPLSPAPHNDAQKQQGLLQDSDFADVPLSELAAQDPAELQYEMMQDALSERHQEEQRSAKQVPKQNLQKIGELYEKQAELGKEQNALERLAQRHSIDYKA